MEIIRNDEANRFAKMATRLPLPMYAPMHPSNIALNRVPHPHQPRSGSLTRGIMIRFPAHTGSHCSFEKGHDIRLG